MDGERASGSGRAGRESGRERMRSREREQDSHRERDRDGRRDHRHSERKDSHRHNDRAYHKERDERPHRRQEGQSRSSRRESRSRSRSPSRHHHRRRHHHDHEASSSAAGSGSDISETRKARDRHRDRRRRDDDSDDSEHESRRRRRKERERRDETSTERADRRRRKRERKHKRSGVGAGGAIMDYGKHGVISETDVTSRLTSEFRQWLVEERHINPETISRAIEKKEMATFIEDYNTATMPSDKYYNLEAHERRMAMIRAGETVEEDGGYDPLADERAAKASFKAQRRAEENSRGTPAQWQSKEQLEALHRVQMERIEAAKMKQLGIQTSANKGVRMDGTEFDRR